ncbi:30S ribosomal protein S14P domain protein [Clostridium sp. KLE 1755]|nr:30S ribosomal protein S14P domain protein [Clostridium sp. KLE 1755]
MGRPVLRNRSAHTAQVRLCGFKQGGGKQPCALCAPCFRPVNP